MPVDDGRWWPKPKRDEAKPAGKKAEERPIIIRTDGKQAKSCYEVCPNMGACDKCDLRFP